MSFSVVKLSVVNSVGFIGVVLLSRGAPRVALVVASGLAAGFMLQSVGHTLIVPKRTAHVGAGTAIAAGALMLPYPKLAAAVAGFGALCAGSSIISGNNTGANVQGAADTLFGKRSTHQDFLNHLADVAAPPAINTVDGHYAT